MSIYSIQSPPEDLADHAFTLNGAVFLKNFHAESEQGRLTVKSNDKNIVVLEALVEDVEIDGVVYSDADKAQQALNRLVHSSQSIVALTEQKYNALLDKINRNALPFDRSLLATELIDDTPQSGRVMLCTANDQVQITIDAPSGFVATYQKTGNGNILFSAAPGKTLVLVDGVNTVQGNRGSSATVTVWGNDIFLRVGNV